MGTFEPESESRFTALEHARFRRIAAPEPLDLLDARYVTHTFAPHVHETYAIGVCWSGAVSVVHGGREHLFGAGDLLLINPGELHTGAPGAVGGWAYTICYPSVGLLRGVADMIRERPGPAPLLPAPGIRDPSLVAAAADALRRLADPGDTLAAGCALVKLAETVLRAQGEMRARRVSLAGMHPRIRRVREYLHDRFASRISVAEMAQVAGLSPYHMIRTFHARVGIPPYMYLEHLRVEQAKALLSAGVPIRETAVRTGFGDQSHFTRRFKRVTGVPPGRYARQLAGE